MARSRVEGAPQLRRALRNLEPDVREHLADKLRSVGQRLLARAKMLTPTRPGGGGLRNALTYKVAPASLTLSLGLVTKGAQRAFFYGYILDAGRKAKTVTIKRGPRAGSTMRIKAIGVNRYNFVFGRRRDFIEEGVPELTKAVHEALDDFARG